jgi:hypothetical protein
MKRVFLSVLFMAVAVQAHAATKVTCTGNGLSFDLAQDSVTSDTKPKFENVSAKNAIVERNLAQASKLGLNLLHRVPRAPVQSVFQLNLMALPSYSGMTTTLEC